MYTLLKEASHTLAAAVAVAVVTATRIAKYTIPMVVLPRHPRHRRHPMEEKVVAAWTIQGMMVLPIILMATAGSLTMTPAIFERSTM